MAIDCYGRRLRIGDKVVLDAKGFGCMCTLHIITGFDSGKVVLGDGLGAVRVSGECLRLAGPQVAVRAKEAKAMVWNVEERLDKLERAIELLQQRIYKAEEEV